MVLVDEADDVKPLSRSKFREQTLIDYLLDTDKIVTTSLHGEIDIMSTGNKSAKMRSKLMTTLDHGVEVIVADEDDRTVEDKALRDTLSTFLVNQCTLRQPRHTATLGGVAHCLKKIKRNVVKEDSVSVIENDDLTLFAN